LLNKNRKRRLCSGLHPKVRARTVADAKAD
jgi:hypothetical protein